ncbi:UNVERIFIED_CONTAM: hypothetical protein Slati_2239000 [Sesamum latifolium]|uniref:Uncharacterized protein n=1 Tax=Sesamum latifolium TaxID=2727402 RepID=A0AAW2WUQ6_9LAMI
MIQYCRSGSTLGNTGGESQCLLTRLLDGDFFKSLAKKPVSKFDALLARAAKYINMEDAQAAKKES